MTDKELMQQALNALEGLFAGNRESGGVAVWRLGGSYAVKEAIDALKLRLKQPAAWVGLTDEEIILLSNYDLEYAAIIGEVQRKLKEKNK